MRLNNLSQIPGSFSLSVFPASPSETLSLLKRGKGSDGDFFHPLISYQTLKQNAGKT
ncbi:hypothetical protein TRQ7_09511 [Thermotoga sp. RQ7]|nr:hypothetical protein TRQ7_09511 [Thermotoga sp. RQ7]